MVKLGLVGGQTKGQFKLGHMNEKVEFILKIPAFHIIMWYFNKIRFIFLSIHSIYVIGVEEYIS